ncbi:MAG TPA: family 20 glycosylhydrolase [Candidatus Coprenecus stercoravium]|uniref:beta-N-acetylhexosaminidase n=1 Tax=Candidatus Coprenecus stercoravium TaxID=2840735 RepID=A0A9D2GPP4_9BACT|nr:family 20 glycosylhydrolase [Candidatus Coprenecus stercoravium]
MIRKFLMVLSSVVLLVPVGAVCRPVSDIIPRPAELQYGSGYFRFKGDSVPSDRVRCTLTGAGPESYTLKVSRDSILITAGDSAGLFYARQTLRQLVEPDRHRIPCVSISDSPRFAWRGYMQDVSRHFFDLEFLKKQIDAMAALKLNRLHLHLTDAAGWRVEIDRYPLLTSFAAWREGDLWKDWWFGDRRYLDEGTPGAYGGYYTKEQLRELVRYAAERYITVVPEIEMPSHSEEVLTAYPELSCTGEPYKHSDFCIGNEKTFEFLENVLTEIMDIFPSQYIHVGGDEASKKAWTECPLCQARMEALGLTHVDELQSYMIRRIGTFLELHGRTLVGWDEIMQGGADSAAVVMVWRGVDQGVRAAEGGNKTIMSPGAFCYFDTYQDDPSTLPPAMGGYTPLSKVYSFEPVPDGLDSAAASNIIGVQANLWCEYIPTEEHAELMIYPRLFALAEVAWSPEDSRDYDDFHRRALRLCGRMSVDGYNVFNLADECGDRPASRRSVKHKALGCKVVYNAPYYPGYAAGGDMALVDGLHGGWTYGDGRWQGFISRNRLDAVVDLGRVRGISSVEMDFMQVCGPEVFLPAEVVISVSCDGEEFTELWRMSREIVRDDRVTFVTDGWKGRARTRYVRVQARSGQYGGFIFTDEIVVR